MANFETQLINVLERIAKSLEQQVKQNEERNKLLNTIADTNCIITAKYLGDPRDG